MTRAANITWHAGEIGYERRAKLLGQRGCVIWLTGLSGSGKSTIARQLEKSLIQDGNACYVLDGDNIRHGLNSDLGFSAADRSENIRRIAHLAALMADAGLIVITAFISPFIEGRKLARETAPDNAFLEIFLDTPLESCEQRDPKGLYKKARAGEISDFTGLDSPYEKPIKPELAINTAETTPQQCAQALMTLLIERKFIAAPDTGIHREKTADS